MDSGRTQVLLTQRRPRFARLPRVAIAGLLVVLAGAAIAVGPRLVDRIPTESARPSLATQLPGPAVTVAVAGTTTANQRRDHIQVRMWPDGRVLIGDMHLFDIATGETEQLAVSLESGADPSVFPLPDGRVVLIYDKDIEGVMVQAEHRVAVLDPVSGAVTDVGRLPRWSFERRLVLRDGRIFGSGGMVVHELEPNEIHDTAYLFDIDTGTTTQLGPLAQPRASHEMLELLDGRVLVMGGEDPDTDQVPGPLTWLEVYDLDSGTSTPVEDSPLGERWAPLYPFVTLADGQVVLGGFLDIDEPCPFFPQQSGGILGAGSGRQIARDETLVFDPTAGTVRFGPLVRPPRYAYVPLGGERALISRQERAFAGCAVDERPVPYAWLGIADFGTGTILGSRNPVTGEGGLELLPEAVYMSGVRLPDGRVAMMEAPGPQPGPSRIDVLTIEP